jgi:FAD/FMN-containing dehydrogenase
VRARPGENEDLFWGLRGGGGNFGVVTSFEYSLFPVGPQIMAGGIAWRGTDAEQVLEMYTDVVKTAPPELTCVAALRIAPPAPWLAKDVHGKPIVALFVCDTDPIAEATDRLRRLKSFGSPVGDVIQARTYISQQSLLDATQPKGRRYYWKSEYLPRLDPQLRAGVIEHAERVVSPHSAILLFPVDGAVNRMPEDYSPAGNRSAAVVLNIAASWERSGDDKVNIEWARTAWESLRPFSTGGTYVNFLTADEGDARILAAYGSNYAGLATLKAKWDPANVFRINKNILPAT